MMIPKSALSARARAPASHALLGFSKLPQTVREGVPAASAPAKVLASISSFLKLEIWR